MRHRALLASTSYRISANRYASSVVVEKRDGRDALGVSRWRAVPFSEFATFELRTLIEDVAKALMLREKRDRARRERRRAP